MSSEHENLKSLLLKEELEVLAQLKQKILSQEQFTHEVSKVLSGAINRAKKSDKSFDRALAKPIKKGVTQAFSDNKQSIVDSMLPIMGQLIRKTVTNSIKQFVSDINRVLEQRFSIKAIKWRWQAFKTGKSYAEIVFQKTISYQVKELFVINRENGLLIQHVGENDMLIDNNAVSAMLTAIQDFIGDSLQSSESGLSSAAIGDMSYFISPGPKAYLATVVKGAATERLKEKSQQLIENIHADFSDLLPHEEKYQQDPEFDEYLRPHLLRKSLSDTPKKINWLPWIIGVVIFVSAISYFSYKRNLNYHSIKQIAQSINGLYIKSINYSEGNYVVSGLLDPLADTSRLNKTNAVLNTQAFFSLDNSIVNKRIQIIANNYKNLNFTFNEGTLELKGHLTKANSDRLLTEIHALAGIKKINNFIVNDNSPEVHTFLNSYQKQMKQMTYQLEQKTIILSGIVKYNKYQNFTKNIHNRFPLLALNDDQLMVADSTDILISDIEQLIINIPVEIDSSKTQYPELVEKLKTIMSRNNSLAIEVTGESDCYGKTSNQHSLFRAQSIASILELNGINSNRILTKISPCITFINNPDLSKLNVSFDVKNLNSVDLK